MIYRTDLAIEAAELAGTKTPPGVESSEEMRGDAKITRIRVVNEEGANAIGKPVGNYVTIELPPFSEMSEEIDEKLSAVADCLKELLPPDGPVLVAGIGNAETTPDALGPDACSSILATRHIRGEIARAAGLEGLRPVAVLAPGVLGQTGIETGELLAAAVEHIKPAAVIAIDALASRSLSRLGCTVQLADTGISPGSGVGNKRKELSRETLGVPVIAMGVPTVVDAMTLAADLLGEEDADRLLTKIQPDGRAMMVTPREIDMLIDRAAFLCSLAVNTALQPTLSPDDILALVS